MNQAEVRYPEKNHFLHFPAVTFASQEMGKIKLHWSLNKLDLLCETKTHIFPLFNVMLLIM